MSEEATYTADPIRQRLVGPLVDWSYEDGRLRRRFKTTIRRVGMLVATEIERVVDWQPGARRALDGTPDEDPWRLLERD